MQESDIESQFLYQSIAQQQDSLEEKQILMSRLTECNQMQDQSVQINFDSEIIKQLQEEIVQLQKKNQHLSDQINEKDNQIVLLRERVERQTLLNETYQIAEMQLKQQVEELKKKIEEIQEQITSLPPQLQNVSKLNLDFSWVNHMERDLSHDGLLERYDRYKSNKPIFREIQIQQLTTQSIFRSTDRKNLKYIKETNQLKQIMILFICFTLIFTKELNQHLRISNCSPGLPYFSVSKPINHPKYQMTLFLATHKACKACCIHEVIFKQLLQDLPHHINFLRIELEDNASFIEQYQIKRFPAIFLETKSGDIYHYNDLLNYETLISFVQYYFHGLQFTQYHSFQEIESAINNQQQLYGIFIIGMFYDQVEYQEEIKQFTQQCKKLYNYRIKFGFLMQQQEIKNINSKFNTYSHILISKYPNHYQFVDDLFAQPILPLINELKIENSKYYLGQALIVIDSIQDNQNYLLKLQNIAKQLPLLRFAWIDGNLNEDRLQMLGIDKFDQETKLTIFNLDSNANAIYSGDIHNLTQILSFYKDFLSMDSRHFHQKYSSIKKEQNKIPSQPYIQYNENTLIILIPQFDNHHMKIIKQLQQVNKKFHNQFNVSYYEANQFKLIYYYNSIIHQLPTEPIEAALREIEKINKEVRFPKEIPLLIKEQDLIDFLLIQQQ